MKVLSPFGPKIAIVKIPKKIINNINLEVDKIISDKKRLKKSDYSKKLVGQVMQEIKLDNKFIKNGIYYILSLRLIPTISFVLINLIMGVLPISLFRFYYISQLGMLPATVIYVNAGSEISKVNSINDIMSFTLIVSFILVAILPILIKFLMNYFTKLNNI